MTPLAGRLLSGDQRALSRALSLVEDRAEGYLHLLADLYKRGGKARRIGVTGPPGAGKSTLVDRLIRVYREKGLKVAVVAVDPSSAFSGGAILGDRIRMQEWATDPMVFIRSMATRGHMGGLAAATDDALTVLDAAGYDVLLVETVGVGQDEVDIVREAETVLVVLMPGMGDEVQALKAGVMEIADVFVINKADREGVERVERELQQTLSLAPEGTPRPAVVKTSALSGAGIEELSLAIEEAGGRGGGGRADQKRAKRLDKFFDLLSERFLAQVKMRLERGGRLDALADAFDARETDPYSLAEKMLPDSPARLEHVGVAVTALAEARRFWEALGLACSGEEEVAEQKVRAAFYPAGESRVELLESTDASGPVGRHLAKRGPGLHHLCLEVRSMDDILARLDGEGFELLDKTPRRGAGGARIAFVHPRAAGGVLVELREAGIEEA